MGERNADGVGMLLAWPVLVLRAVMGGVLMGLANLVPGISGGTMLLASGIYPQFISAIASLTTLRFRLRELVVLLCVTVAAGTGIVLLAGVVKDLVVAHRWGMYSLFIGLTLGGVPVVWGLIGRARRGVWGGACFGFAGMALLAWAQAAGLGAGGASGASNVLLLFLAGLAGAAAMILPGISGGYLLLLLGQYIPILTAVEELRQALSLRALDAVIGIGLSVLLPVGLGVLAGVCLVSHLLRFLLQRYRSVTLGVLLGLLLGAVAGLWPFQQGVRPEPGDLFKGRVLTTEQVEALAPENYPSVRFRPSRGQVGASLALIVAGFFVTAVIAHLGRDRAGTVSD